MSSQDKLNYATEKIAQKASVVGSIIKRQTGEAFDAVKKEVTIEYLKQKRKTLVSELGEYTFQEIKHGEEVGFPTELIQKIQQVELEIQTLRQK